MAKKDWLYTAVAPMLWGTMPVAASAAFPSGHSMLIAAIRSVGAGLCILLLIRKMPPPEWHLRTLMLAIINVAFTFALFFMSATRTGGGMTTLLMALSPFWTTLLAWPLLREKIRPTQIVLIILGVTGVYLLVTRSPIRNDTIGILEGIGASICMGSSIALLKKWGRPPSLFVFMGWQLLAGGVLLVPCALALEEIPQTFTATNAAALLYIVLACTIVAYGLWFQGIDRLGAQPASLLLLLVPVVGLIVDLLIQKLTIAPLQWLGTFLIMASLFVDCLVRMHSGRTPGNPVRDLGTESASMTSA